MDTVLDGSGGHIVISGGSAVRVFYVSSNAALPLINLTISSGRSPDGANGGWMGLSVDGGPAEAGGGFYNCGKLTLRDRVVTANRTGKGCDGASHGSSIEAGGG